MALHERVIEEGDIKRGVVPSDKNNPSYEEDFEKETSPYGVDQKEATFN